MAEHEPIKRSEIEAITGALGSENDVVEGLVPKVGRRFAFGRQDTTMDLYEDPSVIRIQAGDVEARITGVRLVGVVDNGVIFEGTNPEHVIKLRLDADGGGILAWGATPLPEVLANARLDEPAPTHEKGAVTHSYELQTTADASSAAPPSLPLTEDSDRSAQSDRHKQAAGKDTERSNTRVELSGRLVSEPRFHRSAKQQKLIGEFTVEVTTESGEREQHNIVAFDDRARKIKGVLGDGDEVEVKGNLHTTEVVGDDGKPFQKVEVYAFLITPK